MFAVRGLIFVKVVLGIGERFTGKESFSSRVSKYKKSYTKKYNTVFFLYNPETGVRTVTRGFWEVLATH